MQLTIPTSAGDALVEFDRPKGARLLVVLTHGAGGGVDTKDLLAVRSAALAVGGAVARVMQPFRVAGARAPGSAVKQDAAWLEIVAALKRRVRGAPVVLGGRSNGARVACRTAVDAKAAGVIALAFPLHPPGRPENSRADELRSAGVEVIVLNGASDPFGIPDPADAAVVEVLPGETHSLNKSGKRIEEVVTPWLQRWMT